MKYSEHTQLQRYETGEQFKPHTDFFEPNTDEYQKFAHANGNRTWTFMVYLNYVEKGGETLFTAINQKITPKAGLAVIWNNRYTDGNVNYDSLHAGLPVEAGKKFIITKWFRER
jgi:prolyl 4-hydroxylase